MSTEETKNINPDTNAAEAEKATYDAEQAEAAEAAAPDAEGATNAELDELRKAAEESQQRLLRAQADFDNFRRRTRQEKEEFAKYASLKLIEQMLPVIDNFDRALVSSRETQDFEALTKGIEMVYRQLDQVMTQEGLTPIEAVGQPFNPEFHQAIMQVESDEHEEGIVVEEVQKGYMLKDKVIRPSMVKVSM
ncbi:nucleotide exchange factor GrpE [Paenibacillus chitinolyticus]|uniref:Protein GrpE n=1 Tax=Paenibacillus chitinolyticus TaxID=79263 RepID=A0A410X1H4_9BACL|nr:nucleotide exchange factor GrpE [Paenibacillus chitinolyticus]MCY9592541.1 nucleotide exchange factor GrpE [Paenibacillus chitinolyticus]MCY9594856.1 nucleotide exchange factor GrpE [Paenibacillus chitinolyticus]QAV20460.1 nucleotide exchange factor GrpE [Paenibacillus chitinolyticus]